MSDWTPTKLRLAIPGHLRTLGNRAAGIFGPNTQDDQTFPPPNAVVTPEGWNPDTDPIPEGEPTHCLVRSQFVLAFVPMLETRDPDQWEPILAGMAEMRGRDPLTREEIETLCAELLFDDECANLVRISQ